MLAFTRCGYDTADAQSMQSPGRQSRPPALSASLADGAFAACERFALGQNLGAGRIHFARALQSKWVKPPDGRRNPKRPFWAAPLLRRTSVFPLGKTSAQGEFTSPEHCNQMGGAAQKAAEPTKKDIPEDVLFCGTSQHYYRYRCFRFTIKPNRSPAQRVRFGEEERRNE